MKDVSAEVMGEKHIRGFFNQHPETLFAFVLRFLSPSA
jgi:hypothetical protein